MCYHNYWRNRNTDNNDESRERYHTAGGRQHRRRERPPRVFPSARSSSSSCALRTRIAQTDGPPARLKSLEFAVRREQIVMEELACVRCMSSKFRNPNLVFSFNVCGHTMCANCIDVAFVKGTWRRCILREFQIIFFSSHTSSVLGSSEATAERLKRSVHIHRRHSARQTRRRHEFSYYTVPHRQPGNRWTICTPTAVFNLSRYRVPRRARIVDTDTTKYSPQDCQSVPPARDALFS